MKPVANTRFGIRGTIMIFALIVILGGALVLAAWAQMLATQAVYPDTTAERIKCRVALANGRALARQFLLEQMPLDPTNNTNRYTNTSPFLFLTNNWGGFQFPGNFRWTNNFWTNTILTQGNPFSTFGGMSFVDTNNACYLRTNSADTNNFEYWAFRVRSRSPLLAGFPLVIQKPSTSTNTNTPGNDYRAPTAVFWTNVIGYSGFPIVPFTAGTSTNGYGGVFSAPLTTNYAYSNVLVSAQTYPTNTFSSNTAGHIPTYLTNSLSGSTYTTNYNGGTVSVSLNATQTDAILRYVVPTNALTNISFTNVVGSKTYINSYTNVTVTNLIIVGSAQTNALHIIATNSTDLTGVTLSGNTNSRKIILNKSGSSLTLNTTNYASGGVWWLGLSVSGTNALNVTPPASGILNIRGGLRTDGNITVTTGTFTNTIETSPDANVEQIADRVMWLEESRTPTP
ncbi:MAG: hypothetical protein WCS31_07780 [Verrucomicrobiae bacterium]